MRWTLLSYSIMIRAQQLSHDERGSLMSDTPPKEGTHLTLVTVNNTSSKNVSCPICLADSVVPHSPFCSRRCAQVDLGKWLMGDYAISAYEATDDSDLDALVEQADKDPSLS